MKTINILFVDDHSIVRRGIKLMLSKQNSFKAIVDEASDGVEAIFKATTKSYDVILLDINLPLKDGIEVIKFLNAKLENPKILALTMHKEEFLVKQILNEGALGYLLKSSELEELIKAILTVYDGKRYICDEVSEMLLTRKGTKDVDHGLNGDVSHIQKSLDLEITRREFDVLKRIIKGFTDKDISEQLNISQRTVGNHRQNLIKKLKVKNSIELAAYAVRKGLVH